MSQGIPFLHAYTSEMKGNWVNYKNQRLQHTNKATEDHAVFTADKKNYLNVPMPPSSQISFHQGH